MIFQSALEKHRADQSFESWWHESDGDIEDFSRVAIPREVGKIVASEMGEFVTWGVFDNCREHGLTATNSGGWTFCWYEHRNSDLIHIEGCPTSEIKEWGPYGGKDKWDTLAQFWPETYADVAACLVEMLVSAHANTTRADMLEIGLSHGNYEQEKAKYWGAQE